jgi:hypothetical protein
MNHVSEVSPQSANLIGRSRLPVLLLVHIAVCCLSFVYAIEIYSYIGLFAFDRTQVLSAVLTVAPLVPVALLFVFSRFSFGYILGFGFFTVILGYLWLTKFSLLGYDRRLGAISALASLLAFLVPALFVTSPLRQRIVLSRAALDLTLTAILILSLAVIAASAAYNFRLVGLDSIYKFRATLEFPKPLAYAIGVCSTALLPYAFACYFLRDDRWRASATLVLLLLLYPITLTKLALFSPAWLLFLALLARYCEARIAVVLSLLLIVTAGVLLQPLVSAGALAKDSATVYFGPVNFRMIAIPSISLDMYSDFFSRHSVTWFCQISFLKPFVSCPYSEPLQHLMNRNYPLGFANASLFASEGVASVGLKWAPLSALACGLIIAAVNRLSSGLPAIFILLSAGILWQALMNIPLMTSMLTSGAVFLFMLWYITPREIFGEHPRGG